MPSTPPPRYLPQVKVSVLVLALAAVLGGCAQIPALDQAARLKTAADYQTTDAFAASAQNWPQERWWQTYQDVQLDTLIAEALRDAPDMAVASARLARAQASTQMAGAALRPQLSANASISEQKLSYNYLTPRAMTPDGWNDYGRATLDFSWELDFWGKNRAGLAAATSQAEASRAEFAQVSLGLAAAIATQYAELAQLFALRDTLQRSLEIRHKTVTLFDERFANGLETKGSLSEAKARLAGAEGELLSIDEQIGLQRYRIAALIGAGPDRGLAITRPAVNLQAQRGLPAELATNLLGRRPDIAAARLLAQAQASSVDQKKAEFYPNINLSAFIGLQSLNLDMLGKNGSGTGSVGPAISLPIFTAGRLQGELRSRAANYDEAVASYNRAVTQALQDVASVGLSQKALTAQLASAEQAMDAASEAHRIARNRYAGGLANYLEVLVAEDGLLLTQRNLAVLQARAFTLDVALMRALGGGYQSTKI